MRKMLAVLWHEYKMQFGRLAGWGVFLAAAVLSLLDQYPSAGNLARLEFLSEPAYFMCRTMSIHGLVLVFGLMFLLAERFPLDRKTGMKPLLMSCALQKWQYVWGKLLGGFLYTFSMLCMFLALNMAVCFAASPFSISIGACVRSLAKAVLFSAVPVSLFAGFCATALPGVMGIQLFYLLAAAAAGCNAVHVGSGDAVPFYLITSGDLLRLIWVHPGWPFADTGSIAANGAFLIGSGLVSAGLLFVRRGFWRWE